MKTMSRLNLLLTVVLAVGCGGGDVSKQNNDTTSPESDSTPTAQISSSGTQEEAKATLCDLVPPDDVSAAFSGKLLVTSIDAADDTNCLYNLGLGTGEALEAAQLIVHKVQPAMYAAEKENWEGKDNYEILEGVGREAHILNQAQVNVLVDDDTAIRVGLMLITMGMKPPLSKEEIRSGVIEVATGLAGKV